MNINFNINRDLVFKEPTWRPASFSARALDSDRIPRLLWRTKTSLFAVKNKKPIRGHYKTRRDMKPIAIMVRVIILDFQARRLGIYRHKIYCGYVYLFFSLSLTSRARH